MNLIKKIFYYGIGVLIGVLISYIFFGGRNISCSYFPNERVISHILKSKLERDTLQQLCLGIQEIKEELGNSGSVDFQNSTIQHDNKIANIYKIETDIFELKISLLDTVSKILKLNCDKKNE